MNETIIFQKGDGYVSDYWIYICCYSCDFRKSVYGKYCVLFIYVFYLRLALLCTFLSTFLGINSSIKDSSLCWSWWTDSTSRVRILLMLPVTFCLASADLPLKDKINFLESALTYWVHCFTCFWRDAICNACNVFKSFLITVMSSDSSHLLYSELA